MDIIINHNPIMETRNVLDNNDIIIGVLSLPEGTSEDVWTSKLEEYKHVPEIEEVNTQQNEVTYKLSSNFITSIGSNTTTPLKFWSQPNEVWKIVYNATVQCSGVGGNKYSVIAPEESTIEGWIQSGISFASSYINERITSINILNETSINTENDTPGIQRIEAVISVGSIPGFIGIGIASGIDGEIITLFSGSFFIVTKCSEV